MTSKIDTTSLYKILIFIFMWKIIFISHLFLEILQRYYKLVILGTLSNLATPTNSNNTILYENLDVYLKTKNELDSLMFFIRDITVHFKESSKNIG